MISFLKLFICKLTYTQIFEVRLVLKKKKVVATRLRKHVFVISLYLQFTLTKYEIDI